MHILRVRQRVHEAVQIFYYQIHFVQKPRIKKKTIKIVVNYYKKNTSVGIEFDVPWRKIISNLFKSVSFHGIIS